MRSYWSLLAASLVFIPGLASAQLADLVCDDTVRIERQLSGIVGATKHGHGMRSPDTLIEVWINDRSGDWTMVQTYANGTSCIVAMGEHWQVMQSVGDPA